MDRRMRNNRGGLKEENQMGSRAAAAEGGGGHSAWGRITRSSGGGRRSVGWCGVEGGKSLGTTGVGRAHWEGATAPHVVEKQHIFLEREEQCNVLRRTVLRELYCSREKWILCYFICPILFVTHSSDTTPLHYSREHKLVCPYSNLEVTSSNGCC
jgi:hypothetical protein